MSVKAGYVTILGKPNAGKSTLMNLLLGQKISIVTNKPQTTRKRILGILSSDDYQVIFLDTPGILSPAYLLQEKMMEQVSISVRDADVYILIVDMHSDPEAKEVLNDPFVSTFFKHNDKPVIALLNKIDLSNELHVKNVFNHLETIKTIKRIIPVSATLGANTADIVPSILEYLPEHPKFYPDDIVADENERFFVSEIIREKIFELYQEEIPYSTEVLITDFKEREAGKDFISAEIIIERDSQKGIIIGKQGSAIKRLGEISRPAIEEFLGRPVYLDLRVKVRDKWRSDEKLLKSFGYSREPE